MSLALQSFLPFPNGCQGTSPHQQGRGTKMTEHCYCGIDVAKERLDVQVLPHRQRFSVDNNATGWAELVERLHARAVQRAATAERLAEAVTMRRQLCDEHVTIESQAAHVEDAILRRLNKRRLARLKADIHLLDKRMAEIVAADAILAQRYELLTSMRGVGPTLAF